MAMRITDDGLRRFPVFVCSQYTSDYTKLTGTPAAVTRTRYTGALTVAALRQHLHTESRRVLNVSSRLWAEVQYGMDKHGRPLFAECDLNPQGK